MMVFRNRILFFLLFGPILPALEAVQEASARIDEILAKHWVSENVTPNPPTNDETFLRRIYLHTVGRIPTYDESRQFLDADDPDKRRKLIDQLLQSEGYVNHFFNFWGDILRLHYSMGGGKHVNPYYMAFVKKSLRENLPYDEFVSQLITANGQAWENGAVGYTFRDNGMPLDHLANTVRIFLGTRLECAQCHDHPFDKWTQMEFYQMAAFSYGMRPDVRSSVPGLDDALTILRKETPDRAHYANLRRASTDIMGPLRSENTTVVYNPEAQLTLPHDYQYEDAKPRSPVQPGVMFGNAAQPDIQSYAQWMTSPDNPRFTLVIANRLWKHAMGVGFIEPLDELRDTTRSHIPELSEYLTELMVNLDYDMQAFLAAIFNSQVYQRKVTPKEPNPEEFYHFPGPILRRMTAEQTWDSVVTLINPHTEGGDWKLAQQQKVREARQLMMLEAINQYSGKDLAEWIKKALDMRLANNTERTALETIREEARKAGNKARAKEFQTKAQRKRMEYWREVVEVVYNPVLEYVEDRVVTLQTPLGKDVQVRTSEMVTLSGGIRPAFRQLQSDWEEALYARKMKELGINHLSQQRLYRKYRFGTSKIIRAAHLVNPAPPGHFLRQFGQSDRQSIEASNDKASIPQALALLNGTAFQQIAKGHSRISFEVANHNSGEAKARFLFQAILTRQPTQQELDILLPSLKEPSDHLVNDVTFALLNSPEFFFVQ